jgi:hypothetical protein
MRMVIFRNTAEDSHSDEQNNIIVISTCSAFLCIKFYKVLLNHKDVHFSGDETFFRLIKDIQNVVQFRVMSAVHSITFP